MNSLSKELAKRFAFNLQLLDTLGDGLDTPAWSAAPGDGGNSAHWILGHLASSRRSLLRGLGVEIEPESWEASFGMGAQPRGGESYPDVAFLIDDLRARQVQIDTVVGGLTDAAASQDYGARFPDGGVSALDAVSFLNFHESYHLGQIGLLRRQTGHPGFA